MAQKTKPKSSQADFTRGRWQAGRLTFPGRGADPADVWVVDVIVNEELADLDDLGEEDDGDGEEVLRAIRRYRPARDNPPDLGPVIDGAIRHPVDGTPHLPALVRVATPELAAEIHAARPEVKVVIGPTALIESSGRELAEEVLPDAEHGEEAWRWLEAGVELAQVKRLFLAMDAALPTLVGELLHPGQLLRVAVPALGLDPAFAVVHHDEAVTGASVISVGIAPDPATRKAWDEDGSASREIVVFACERDELSPEAFAELRDNDLQVRGGYFPRVLAGGDEERMPTPREVEIAIAVLEAIAVVVDPLAADPTPGKLRNLTLSSGGKATVCARPDEILLDQDDGDDDDDGLVFEPDDDVDRFLAMDREGAWAPAPAPAPATFRAEPKPGRNDPCHCGSGLKYKKCHGK